jgi:hypothetical protein
MRIIGLLFGVLSAIGMLFGLIPFLGWLNWIVIPIAILALIFSAIGKSRGGMVLSGVTILFGILRLIFGGGIF